VNIHVANLPREYDEEKVRALFAAHGTVASVKLDIDRVTGHHSGFAFVEMPNDDEARAAMTALHGKKLTDYALSLKEVVPPEAETHGPGARRGKGRKGVSGGGPKGTGRGGGFHGGGFQGVGAPRRGGQRGS
jgi:RNA recognition motif-containing protein